MIWAIPRPSHWRSLIVLSTNLKHAQPGRKSALTLLSTALLTACHPESQAVAPSMVTENVKDVIERANDNQVYVRGGTFTMGDFGAVGEDGVWRPYFPPTAHIDVAHQVTLTDYSISKHKTTWFDYDTFLLATGRPVVFALDDRDIPREPYNEIEDKWAHVDHHALVTWQQAKDYCAWLGQETGLGFDLPSSAQWEFAARNRGSKDWLFATHDGKPVENSSPFADRVYFTGLTGPIGSRLPANPLGLYDMAGNADEWVNDWYSETYYTESDGSIDPTGPAEGEGRVLRALGAGSLAFSFSHRVGPERLADGFLVVASFRCAVDQPEIGEG